MVRVDNAAGPGSFPQDWWNWGGIVGDVSLQPVGRVALSDLGVMPQLSCRLACGSVLVRGVVRNMSSAPQQGAIDIRVSSPSGSTWAAHHELGRPLAPGGARQISFRMSLPSARMLWSPSNPALYRVQVSTTAGDRVEQVNSLKVGMRTIKVSHGILYLNGKRLWLHGASIHEDVQGSGASMTEGDINTIVSQLRSVGANITRAHYALSEELLDALDQAGILVWSQPPVDHADPQLAGRRTRARAVTAARHDPGRAQPPVGGGRLGRQRASPTPDSDPGTRTYLSGRSRSPAAGSGRGGRPGHALLHGLPGSEDLLKLDVLGIDSYFGWYTASRATRSRASISSSRSSSSPTGAIRARRW